MHFLTTLTTTLLALSSLTSASPLRLHRNDNSPSATTTSSSAPQATGGTFIYAIDAVTLRKPNGLSSAVSAVQFNITQTVGEKHSVTCSAYDSSTGGPPSTFIEGTMYACGNNSPFQFTYRHESDGIILKYTMGQTSRFIATGTILTTCRAGGSGSSDYVCNESAPTYLTIVNYNGEL